MNKWQVKSAQSGFNTGIQNGERFLLLTENKITKQTGSTKRYLLFFALNSGRALVGLYKSTPNETQVFIPAKNGGFYYLLCKAHNGRARSSQQ